MCAGRVLMGSAQLAAAVMDDPGQLRTCDVIEVVGDLQPISLSVGWDAVPVHAR